MIIQSFFLDARGPKLGLAFYGQFGLALTYGHILNNRKYFTSKLVEKLKVFMATFALAERLSTSVTRQSRQINQIDKLQPLAIDTVAKT